MKKSIQRSKKFVQEHGYAFATGYGMICGAMMMIALTDPQKMRITLNVPKEHLRALLTNTDTYIEHVLTSDITLIIQQEASK